MVWTVNSGFDAFYSSINLSDALRSVANARRDDIIRKLNGNLEVVDAFNSGSIHRFTAVGGFADIDVITVLHYGKHIKDKPPKEVLQNVRDVLGEYRTNVRKNGQAVTLHYKTWPNVDIVPACGVADDKGSIVEYQIPDMNTGKWISTNPKKHTSDIEQRSKSAGPLFRKIIKMVKWWNKKHSNYLQSYHIEVMALYCFDYDPGNYSWGILQYFDKAAELASAPLWHDKGFADDYLDYNSRQEVVKRLRAARDVARSAWYLTFGDKNDHSEAIRKWRQLFGDAFPNYG